MKLSDLKELLAPRLVPIRPVYKWELLYILTRIYSTVDVTKEKEDRKKQLRNTFLAKSS